jgi:hypothetical protein
MHTAVMARQYRAALAAALVFHESAAVPESMKLRFSTLRWIFL